MTTTQRTVEIAKMMSFKDLLKIGRFNLRMIAEALGLLDTQDSKNLFMSKSNEEQAEAVYAKIHGLPLFKRDKPSVDDRIKMTMNAFTSALIAIRHAYVQELIRKIELQLDGEMYPPNISIISQTGEEC